ncbi:MAG TPA: hypothetical protein VGC80_16875 [Acetobacteraceae bacterium]|jgi:hypothetical protein
MPAALAVIVEPLTLGGEGGPFREEAGIAGALAALGALQDQSGVLLLHADATVALAVALGGLDLRPAVPLEASPDPGGGARVVHVLLPPPLPGVAEAMYEASLHAEAPETADDMIAAGLIEPVDLPFRVALERYRPDLVLALAGPYPSPGVRQALDQAEDYRRYADCPLLIAGPRDWPAPWRLVDEFLTSGQQGLSVVPIPSEDAPAEASGREEGEDEPLRRMIEREAMAVARLSVAVERAILIHLGELR